MRCGSEIVVSSSWELLSHRPFSCRDDAGDNDDNNDNNNNSNNNNNNNNHNPNDRGVAVYIDGSEEVLRRILDLDLAGKVRMLGFVCRTKKKSVPWARGDGPSASPGGAAAGGT